MTDKNEEGELKVADMMKLIEQHGCMNLHNEVQACLKKFDHDWNKCENEIAAFGDCISAGLKDKK